MLYNPNWNKKAKTKEAKADPMKLSSLIAWLEKQPGDATYHYHRPEECLLAQYFTDAGHQRVAIYGRMMTSRSQSGYVTLPPVFDLIACRGRPTMRAALRRARSFA